MCTKAVSSKDFELSFFSKKNKAPRTVYLSQRTVNLLKKYIEDKDLKEGMKLFDKPDKNL
jgi:integrase